jgi:hypothetical protein
MGYIEKINSLYKSKYATEHSYRPALKEYLEALLPNITATNEPKRRKMRRARLHYYAKQTRDRNPNRIYRSKRHWRRFEYHGE